MFNNKKSTIKCDNKTISTSSLNQMSNNNNNSVKLKIDESILRSIFNQVQNQPERKQVQSATISGSKAPPSKVASQTQINLLTNSSNTNTTSGGSTNFTSTKRKRASLFNIFSFQKSSVASSSYKTSDQQPQQKQQVIDNELISDASFANTTNTGLPPPPPEFADNSINQRRYSASVKVKSINEQNSFKQSRSIFNALKRKSVKSMPPVINPIIFDIKSNDSFNNKNNDDSILSYSSSTQSSVFLKSVPDTNENNNNNINNSSDISDTESTISNLFCFDHYILPKEELVQQELPKTFVKKADECNLIENKLNYAQENLVEDESSQLVDLNEKDVDYVKKEKLRKHSRKQILSTITKSTVSSSSSTINTDQCINPSNNMKVLNLQQQQQQQKSTTNQTSTTASLTSLTSVTKLLSDSQSLSPPPSSQQQQLNRKHDLSLIKGSKSNKSEQGFRSYINDSDSENNHDECLNHQQNLELLINSNNKKLTLEEVDTNANSSPSVRTRRIQSQTGSLTNIYDNSKNFIDNNNKVKNINNDFNVNILRITFEKQNKIRHSEMVHIKKGLKLRDLLNPVLNTHNLNIDNFNIYSIENNTHSNSNKNNNDIFGDSNIIDSNMLCDQFVNAELNLKQKTLTKTETQITDLNQTLSIETKLNLNQESNSLNSSPINNGQTSKPVQSSSSSSSPSPSSSPSSLQITPKLSTTPPLPPTQPIKQPQQLNSPIQTTPSLPPIPTSPPLQLQSSPIELTKSVPQLYHIQQNPKSTQKRFSTVAINDEPTTPSPTLLASTRNSTSSVSSFTSLLSTQPGGTVIASKSKSYSKIQQFFNPNINNNKITNNNEQLNKLLEKLDSYLKELPTLPDNIKASLCSYDEFILDIDPEWKNVVGEKYAQGIPPKQQRQQMAIWELFTTEVSHIKLTKVIINLYLNCLNDLKLSEQTRELFKNIEIDKLFLNIVEIFNCNLKFWQDYLYEHAAKLSSTKLINPCNLKIAFLQFNKVFSPYDKFCMGQNDANDYLKLKYNENEYFRQFIQWAENHQLSERLKLADLMMKPIQRITKYNLLLEKIQNFTENSAQCSQLTEMQNCVKDLVNSFNSRLGSLSQFNNVVDSIESYEAIVGPTPDARRVLDKYKNIDLRCPVPGCPNKMREIIHQGPLKLKDSSKSLDVYCILFTDVLLITKERRSSSNKTPTYKIIKPPIPINRIKIEELKEDKALLIIQFNSDYNVVEAFYMLTTSPYKRWIDALIEAKNKYIAEIESHKNSSAEQTRKISLDVFANNSDNCQQSLGEVSESETITKSRQNSVNGIIDVNIENDNSNQTNDAESEADTLNTAGENNIVNEEVDKNNFSLPEQIRLVDDKEIRNYQTININMDAGETEIDDEEVGTSESTIKNINNEKSQQLNNSFDLVEDPKSADQTKGHSRSSSSSSSTSSSSSSSTPSSPCITALPPKPIEHDSTTNLNQQNELQNSRKYNKLDRKNRYNTDPLTNTQQKDRLQDNDILYRISKRNSLNDRLESQAIASSSISPDEQKINHQEIFNNKNKNLKRNIYGDSTSTIMSTDSGVSSTTYGCQQSNSVESMAPEFKLSEEEVDDIYKDFIKKPNLQETDANSNNAINTTNNESQASTEFLQNNSFDEQYLVTADVSVEKLVQEIEKQQTYIDNYSTFNNRNDYCEINSNDLDDSKNEYEEQNNLQLNSNINNKQTVLINNFDNNNIKSIPQKFPYPDKLTIPLVVGQLPGQSDFNNNNIIQHKLSPKVYNSLPIHHTYSEGTNLTNRKFTQQKQKFERNPNSTNNTMNYNHYTHKLGEGQNKLRQIKSTSLSMPAKNIGGKFSTDSSAELLAMQFQKSKGKIAAHYSSSLNDSQINENIDDNNDENEIELITSAIPAIVKLSPTRSLTQNNFEKRCATPIDYVYTQQFENNRLTSPNSSYVDNYDPTIQSANNSSFRFNNHQLVHLLHTTQDATEV